jgi:hypothetical protein
MNILQLTGTLFGRVALDGFNYDFISQFLETLNVSDFVNRAVSTIGALTLTVVLALAMLIGMIRLFFELLKSYATIVLAVVMSPIYLMMGAIPGRSMVFTNWIKILIGNLIVWPTVLIVVVMFYAFVDGAVNTTGGGFMPPFLLNVGYGISNTIVAIMGLAILLALPDIVKSVKGSIAPKEGFANMVVSAGWKNTKSGPRYAPLPAGAVGLAYGAAEGAGYALKNPSMRRDPVSSLKLIKHSAGYSAGRFAGRAKGFAKGFEQVTEGKALDPNAWENVLLANAQDAKDKKRKDEKTKLENMRKKTVTAAGTEAADKKS